MKEVRYSLLFVISLFCVSAMADSDRYTISLDGNGWYLWQDKDANWKNDKLYLPDSLPSFDKLPVNPPTCGWEQLTGNSIAVSVPGTVEEYLTRSDQPGTSDQLGVSWWSHSVKIPATMKGRRILLHFESVRMRAEVYLDGRLVGYDIIGETPFYVDMTDAVRFGKPQTLAVRITNPGGNFHWQDFEPMRWGNYLLPPSRCFGGIIGRVRIDCVLPLHITDLYMQNTETPQCVNAIVSFSAPAKGSTLEVSIAEKDAPDHIILRNTVKAKGKQVTIPIALPDAKLWDLNTPYLYICKVRLKSSRGTIDNDKRTFGFRSFEASGIDKNAVLRLNGHRVMLRSAISWGYFPVQGLAASQEIAINQVSTAKKLGLNTLNFHRSIGSPVVLEASDSLGLMYYEEPGSFHSANRDPFIRAVVNEKLHRMILRDRSHPSLMLYNLINELGGPNAKDSLLTSWRMDDMRKAHALDPSRLMTYTSGWASREDSDEDAKMNMRPFDSTLYRRGWFDNHRAGGPATYEETYYNGPSDNYMFTDNRTEVFMRGEEGAISTPPRLQLIHDALKQSGKPGWDGRFWERQYQTFKAFFDEKQLAKDFGSLDSLTSAMGHIQLEHQGRRIQSMRMQDIGDAYMINGWESMPYDNHSGVVDIYRNPKSAPTVLNYYNQPLYVAVSSRNQVVRIPGKALVDFHMVNEKDLKGEYTLEAKLISPTGLQTPLFSQPVAIEGGDVFGQLLKEAVPIALSEEGTYRIVANIRTPDGDTKAEGFEEIVGVDWQPSSLKGNGAYYGYDNDKVATFYQQQTGSALPAFSQQSGKLDWLIVNRSSLDAPTDIPAEQFSALKATWYFDNDMRSPAGTKADVAIQRTFVSGQQPDELLPANQPFSTVWEGSLTPTETGQYLLGLESNRGIRLYVDGRQLIDNFGNSQPISETRPVTMEKDKAVRIRVEYRQNQPDGYVRMEWSLPSASAIKPQELFDRVRNDGTTLVVLGSAETWMQAIADYTGIRYDGYYSVGSNWVGGVHFVRRHPLFEGLPVNVGMNWPYQAVVRNGDRRFGFRLHGEELAAGSYRSWPFELGTSVGVIPCGKGCIVFSTLDIADNLLNPSGPAEVARKLLCNFIQYRNTYETISLWPDGAPNTNGKTDDEPTLTVYHPQHPNGKTIVMCPGGGYGHLALTHEGHDMAEWMTSMGITYCVLKYRLPYQHHEVPRADAEQAMRIVRSHADEWGIDPHKVGIMGGSAGGHLAASLATLYSDKSVRPDFQILLYPVISMDQRITNKGTHDNLIGEHPSKDLLRRYSLQYQVNKRTPPAFIALSADDKGVVPDNSELYKTALEQNGIAVEMHVYPTGGHGWGYKDSFKYKKQWTKELEHWLSAF